MRVRVKCFATLADHTPSQGFLDLEDGAAVEAMLPILGLEVADIKLVFVNSRNSGLETVLADGDQVGIFPAVGGG
ncbi:MAG: MoaD/ThiS family protein [Desulfomicrobium sp.]|nr:MoaD/ThiS family protein [Pseudomonadota bacterium]MBV1712205.1 MoaD/ThiS family protein [Desulfomicrobium sp.]MBU4572843.1 MoaD/ThiS family protein [Pseudomonadota bacterium]MBU4594838.1 MoaD/ThiS family protein [Pseudomonadota bacterium]MBV1718523.1 MoaD/ThiS family protein [Desulfomicrobium sp.]